MGACSRTSSTSTTCTWSRRRTSARCACPRCSRPAATRAPTWPGPASWPAWAARWAGRTTPRAGTRPARPGLRPRPPRPRRSPSASAPTEVATAMALAVPGGRRRAARVRHGGQGAAGRVRGAGRRARRAARRPPARRPIRARSTSGSRWWAATRERLALDGPAVPGGLAVKLFPCCYALQRPIAALRALADVDPDAGRARGGAHAARARSPRSSTPRRRPAWRASSACSTRSPPRCSTAGPGSRASPTTPSPGPRRRRCSRRVEVDATPGGDWLLAGDVAIELTLADGSTLHAQLDLPPGAPDRPPSSGRAGREGGRLRRRPGRRGPRGRLGRRRGPPARAVAGAAARAVSALRGTVRRPPTPAPPAADSARPTRRRRARARP